MLAITTGQIGALRDDVHARFMAAVLAQIAEGLGEREPSERTRALADEAARRARAYDIVDAHSVARFALIIATVNPDFDQHPSVRGVLRNPRIAPGDRIEALVTCPALWALAKGG